MTTNLPIQSKADIIEDWIASNEAVAAFVSELNESQWSAKPHAEKWSIAGHVEHLFLSGNPVSSALKIPKEMLEARFGLYEGEHHDFLTLKAFYKNQLAKNPLPINPVAPSDEALPQTELLQSWAMIKSKIPQRLEVWTEEDLDRYCLLHPLLGPLSVRGMLFFTIFHTDHHLESVKEMLAEMA